MPAQVAMPTAPPAGARLAVFLRRPASRLGRVALVAVNLATVLFFLLSPTRHGLGLRPDGIDLEVYRIGGRVWLSGGYLYGHLPPTSSGISFPFTYPPIAAVVFSPLSLVPAAIAFLVMALGAITLTAAVLQVFLARLATPPRERGWALAWLLPPALLLEPVHSNLALGQINVALMALVTLDCLTAPRWARGALAGIAAAVKLTPALFVLFFLLRRDYRAAAAMTASFAAATAAGFLLAWRDSARYWTNIVFDTARIGNPAYAANQSIQGVLARAGLDPHTPAGTGVWLGLSVAFLAAACLGMRHALAAGDDCLALVLNALAALLISPISWSHHWVWIAPALLTLAALTRRHRTRLPLTLAAGGAMLFWAGPQWWFPAGHGREVHWAFWQQIIGSSYVYYAALVLLLSAGARLTTQRPAVSRGHYSVARPKPQVLAQQRLR
jgi:alpha-1,2-mannosyltransferase